MHKAAHATVGPGGPRGDGGSGYEVWEGDACMSSDPTWEILGEVRVSVEYFRGLADALECVFETEDEVRGGFWGCGYIPHNLRRLAACGHYTCAAVARLPFVPTIAT